MFKNIIILIFLLLFSIALQHIVIPFKGNDLFQIYDKYKNTKKDFFEHFIMSSFYNQIYTVIGIGNPRQNVVLNIVPNQIDFIFNKVNCLFYDSNIYIDKNNLSPNNRTSPTNITNISYKKELSIRFKRSNISLSKSYTNNYYFSATDNLEIDDYRNILTNYYNSSVIYPHAQLHLVNFSFIYEETDINNDMDKGKNENEKKEEDEQICGSFGLTFFYQKNNNKLLEQLKSSNITQNYYWSFNYTSLDKGYIVLGILPHEYNPEKYDADDLEETYTLMGDGDIKWGIDLNQIYFFSSKNKKNEQIHVKSIIAEGVFEFTLQLIVGSFSYKELIIEHFFQEFYDKKICIEEEYKLDINYSIVRCKKDGFENKIKSFPSLHIYSRALQNVFELTYEDLFVTAGDYIYFLVIFRKGKVSQNNQTWKLGIPFLKKNQMILNTDTKRIGFYTENKINIVGEKNPYNKKINKNKNKKDESEGFFGSIINFISLRTFFEIMIAILFIVALIYLGKKLYNFRNKQKKPYELQDEDYDYFSNNSEIKKKKDNVDINNSSNDNNSLTGQIIEMKSH